MAGSISPSRTISLLSRTGIKPNRTPRSRHSRTRKDSKSISARSQPDEAKRLLRRIRLWIAVFIVGLVLSGVTAFPLLSEVNLIVWWFYNTGGVAKFPLLAEWIVTIQHALLDTQKNHPYLFYGTDWLAFGHIIIALFFIGPYRDPVRNVFILHVGIAACVLVFPLAFICGPIRGIPLFWQLIDCSFGVLGIIPLLFCLRDVKRLERLTHRT